MSADYTQCPPIDDLFPHCADFFAREYFPHDFGPEPQLPSLCSIEFPFHGDDHISVYSPVASRESPVFLGSGDASSNWQENAQASTTPVALLGAYRARHGISTHRCSCDQPFPTAGALEKHAISSRHPAWRCEEADCGKEFFRRDSFARHKSLHKLPKKSNVCPHCARSFKRKEHRDQHMKSRRFETCPHQTPGTGHWDIHSKAVNDLKLACQRLYPGDSEAIETMQQRLEINDDSTSEEVAMHVVKLVTKHRFQ